MSIIKLEQIGFRYNEHWVLKNVSFEVNKGEFWGILGPNGSGKTTLLNVIDGILKPQEGEIWINGTTCKKLKRGESCKNYCRCLSGLPNDLSLHGPGDRSDGKGAAFKQMEI